MSLTFGDGNRVPEFLLPRLGGTTVRYPDSSLKSTIFYLWAPWHKSVEALKDLEEFHIIHGVRANLVAIAFDVRGHAETARAVRKAGVTYPVLLDNTCLLSRLWGVKTIPLTVVVDADGFVERVAADASEKTLQSALTAEVSAKRTRILEPGRAGSSDTKSEILLQHVGNLLGRGRGADALDCLRKALKLDPGNQIVEQQVPLLEAIA